MLKWVLLGGGCLAVLLLVLALVVLRRNTVYITGDFGFVALSSGERHVHHTDDSGLTEVVRRLLAGDLYDNVWASHLNDEYDGVVLGLESGVPTLDASFKTHRDAARISAFREAMKGFGYPCAEDSDGFNGGTTESHRQTNFTYELPRDAAKIVTFVRAALQQLQGRQEGYYLSAWLFADGPGHGSGLKISRDEDPLRRVLTKDH